MEAIIDTDLIDEILDRHNCDKSKIIAIMQDVQSVYRYLPQEALTRISERVGLSKTKIYGVATFYGNFSFEPKGKYVLKVCRGTSCHVRRSDTVLQAIYNVTGMGEYKTSTDDGLFSIEVVSCLGACSLSPVVMVNDEVHPAMTPDKAMRLIAEIRTKEGVK